VPNFSYEAIWDVIRLKPEMVDPPEALVLYALALFAKNKEISPGLKVLCQVTKLSRRALITAIAGLEEKGLIAVERFKPGAGIPRGTNRYLFTDWPDDWCIPRTSAQDALVHELHGTSAQYAPLNSYLKESEEYEKESGSGIEESETARQQIRALDPAGRTEPAAGNGQADFLSHIKERHKILRAQRRRSE
jgi:Helix-turn-helix domain